MQLRRRGFLLDPPPIVKDASIRAEQPSVFAINIPGNEARSEHPRICVHRAATSVEHGPSTAHAFVQRRLLFPLKKLAAKL